MITVETNADLVARAFKGRSHTLGPAMIRATRRWMHSVANESSKNLSGPGTADPGTYPVPVRTGTLRRAGKTKAVLTIGMVFYDMDTAPYARRIHNGTPASDGVAAVPGRPFLNRAAEAIDGQEIVRDELLKILR